ncbi:MAG: ABC transporter permease subunit, partial [Planctomycetota bacterium]
SGARALGATVALAFAALSLAVLSSFPLVFSAARTLVPSRWLRGVARLVCVFLRAIPELFWAFLFVELFGAGALPAVLALALHNAGILGRLGADLAENLDPGPRRALELAGASRGQTAIVAVTPEGLPRYLTFVFYRLETCVRESTVLGFVGVVSIGWFVEDARARQRYDLVLYFIALGALVVLLADLTSTIVRRWIRNA